MRNRTMVMQEKCTKKSTEAFFFLIKLLTMLRNALHNSTLLMCTYKEEAFTKKKKPEYSMPRSSFSHFSM